MVSRFRFLPIAAAAALALAGCQTKTGVTDVEAVRMIRESPTMKSALIRDCYDRWSKYKYQLTDEFVAQMGGARGKAVETFCTRLYNGIASGRISEADLDK